MDLRASVLSFLSSANAARVVRATDGQFVCSCPEEVLDLGKAAVRGDDPGDCLQAPRPPASVLGDVELFDIASEAGAAADVAETSLGMDFAKIDLLMEVFAERDALASLADGLAEEL